MQCHPDNIIFYSFRQLFLCRQLYSLGHRQNLTLVSPSVKPCQNLCSGPSTVYQDLSTCHDWPVKKAIVDLPIRMTGNSKCTSGNLLSPLGAQNKDQCRCCSADVTNRPLKWCLWCRLTSLWHRYLPKRHTTVKIQHNIKSTYIFPPKPQMVSYTEYPPMM